MKPPSSAPDAADQLRRLREELTVLHEAREKAEGDAAGIPTLQQAVKRVLRDRDARTSQRVEELRERIGSEHTRARDAVAGIERIASNYAVMRRNRPLPLLLGTSQVEDFVNTMTRVRALLDESAVRHDMADL